MLDLAEESMQKQRQFDMTATKTSLDLPILTYNRQQHFGRDLESASRWLRPLNRLAKKAFFDVKSKLKNQENALRSGAGRVVAAAGVAGRSFARKPVSRVQQARRESRFQHALGSPASSMSEGAPHGLGLDLDPPRSKARAKLLSIISSAALGLGSGSVDEHMGGGLEQSNSTSFEAAGGSLVSVDTGETHETAHRGARKVCLCFPGIAQSHSFFLPWAQEMDVAGVELWAVCLPGRADRIREPYAHSVHLAAGVVGDCMACLGLLQEQGVGLDLKKRAAPTAHRRQKHGSSQGSVMAAGQAASGSVASTSPSLSSGAAAARGPATAGLGWEWDKSSATGSCVCLFGHSVGGVVAFETARYLRRAFGLDVPHLFVSCVPNPEFVTAHNSDKFSTKRHALGADALLGKLGDMGDPFFDQVNAHRKRLFGLTGDDDEWDSDLDGDGDGTDEYGRAVDNSGSFDLLARAVPLARADFCLLELYAYEHADDGAARRTGVFDREDEYVRERRRDRERLQGVAVTTVMVADDTVVSGEDHLKTKPVGAGGRKGGLLLKGGGSLKTSSRQGAAGSREGGRRRTSRRKKSADSSHGSFGGNDSGLGSGSGSEGSPVSRRASSRGSGRSVSPGGVGVVRKADSFTDMFATSMLNDGIDEGDDDDDCSGADAPTATGSDFMSSVIGKLAHELSLGDGPSGQEAQGRGAVSQSYLDAVEDWRLVTMASSGERDGASVQLRGGGHHRCLVVPANQALVLRDVLVKMGAAVATTVTILH